MRCVMVVGDPSFSSLRDGGSDPVERDSSYVLSNYVMDARQMETAAKSVAGPSRGYGAVEVGKMFVHSLAYSALQSPVDGATQLLNGAIRPVSGGRDVIPRFEMMSAPGAAEFGSPEWVAKLAGGGIGTILPFYLGGKAAVRAIEPLKDVRFLGPAIQRAGILEENSVGQLAFKGAVYEGVFHPVDEASGSLWGQRAVNFGSGALSFLALGVANKGMRESFAGRWAFSPTQMAPVRVGSEFFVDAASGAVAGVTDTTLHAIAGGAPPTWESLAQSAGEYGLMSVFLRLGRMPIDKAASEKAPVEAKEQVVPRDEGSLRQTLPFDKNMPYKMFYREMPDPPAGAPRMRVSHEELSNGQYHRFEHKGQKFAVSADGKAYTLAEIEPGVYELVLTDKIILDRLNEVQVPWPPIQSQEQYRARAVFRLEDWLNWRPEAAQ